METALDIVTRLRRDGHDLQICIAGRSGSPAYLAYLRGLVKGSESWASIQTDLPRELALGALLGRYKYGLHLRKNEQFGIGVAEMLGAGCLPFVSGRGGPVEIVGGHEPLSSTPRTRLSRRSPGSWPSERVQERLRKDLEHRAQMFSAERFMAEMRKIVKEILAA